NHDLLNCILMDQLLNIVSCPFNFHSSGNFHIFKYWIVIHNDDRVHTHFFIGKHLPEEKRSPFTCTEDQSSLHAFSICTSAFQLVMDQFPRQSRTTNQYEMHHPCN